MKIRVLVTEDDVREGSVDCFTCPLARRLNTFMKDGYVVAVYPTAIEVLKAIRPIKSYEQYRLASRAKRVHEVPLPQEAARFVRRFDGAVLFEERRRTAPPRAFTLVIPSRYATKKPRRPVEPTRPPKAKKSKPKPWWET